MAANSKPPTGKRKSFVRTKIPLSENLISGFLMLLTVGIGIAIAIKGKHFDPNRFVVKLSSLKSTAGAVDGKSQTIATATEMEPPGARAISTATSQAESQEAPAVASAPAKPAEPSAGAKDAEGGGEGGGGAPAPAPKGEPMEIALDGIKPMSPTEFYNAENLYEKIDGRSPAYQNFHVQTLRCRTFSVTAEPGSFVDVYEYAFDSPVDAFGMFSLERDPKGKPIDFIADGYSGEMGWFFRRGVDYVQIIASDQKPKTIALAEALARNRAKELPENDGGLAGRRKLPQMGLITDSVAYIPENAQGQSGLKDVFQAKYSADGVTIPFFIMVAKPEDASKAWKSFHDFCTRFGKAEDLPDVKGAKIFSALLFGKTKIVFVREGEIGGAFDVTDAAKGRAFVEKYLKGEVK
jgi:hypothetical protein